MHGIKNNPSKIDKGMVIKLVLNEVQGMIKELILDL